MGNLLPHTKRKQIQFELFSINQSIDSRCCVCSVPVSAPLVKCTCYECKVANTHTPSTNADKWLRQLYCALEWNRKMDWQKRKQKKKNKA